MLVLPTSRLLLSLEFAALDRRSYLACIGWIILDAAIVIGVIVHR